MEEMEVRTWHICQKSKAAKDKRFRVMAKPGGRFSHPPSVKPNDTGRGVGVSVQGEKEGREGRQLSTETRSKMDSSKSWRRKKT